MGAWGYNIQQDDTVADIVDFVTDHLKKNRSLDLAVSKAQAEFSELLNDEDERPLLWLALALVQWKYNKVDDEILNFVRHDIENGRGLNRWSEPPRDLKKRKEVLSKFLQKIELVNPKPSPLPKLVVRKAPYSQGDCLSILLSDGYYTAALVLDADNSDPESGMNLIAVLDYYDQTAPNLADFKRRNWLVKSHGNWNNEREISWYSPVHYRRESKRFAVVGNIPLKWSDPKKGESYASWTNLGEQVIWCREYRK